MSGFARMFDALFVWHVRNCVGRNATTIPRRIVYLCAYFTVHSPTINTCITIIPMCCRLFLHWSVRLQHCANVGIFARPPIQNEHTHWHGQGPSATADSAANTLYAPKVHNMFLLRQHGEHQMDQKWNGVRYKQCKQHGCCETTPRGNIIKVH